MKMEVFTEDEMLVFTKDGKNWATYFTQGPEQAHGMLKTILSRDQELINEGKRQAAEIAGDAWNDSQTLVNQRKQAMLTKQAILSSINQRTTND